MDLPKVRVYKCSCESGVSAKTGAWETTITTVESTALLQQDLATVNTVDLNK